MCWPQTSLCYRICTVDQLTTTIEQPIRMTMTMEQPIRTLSSTDEIWRTLVISREISWQNFCTGGHTPIWKRKQNSFTGDHTKQRHSSLRVGVLFKHLKTMKVIRKPLLLPICWEMGFSRACLHQLRVKATKDSFTFYVIYSMCCVKSRPVEGFRSQISREVYTTSMTLIIALPRSIRKSAIVHISPSASTKI